MSDDVANEEEYEELSDVIPFHGFRFQEYRRGEEELLAPRLTRLGFTHIRFSMGEYDSFGPLTRVCHAVDSDGNDRRFIYG